MLIDGVWTGVRYQLSTLDNVTVTSTKADTILIDGRIRITGKIDVIGNATTKIATLTVDAKSVAESTAAAGEIKLNAGTSSLLVQYSNVTTTSVTNPAPPAAVLSSGAAALGSVPLRASTTPWARSVPQEY